jgi:hypothetical protein
LGLGGDSGGARGFNWRRSSASKRGGRQRWKKGKGGREIGGRTRDGDGERHVAGSERQRDSDGLVPPVKTDEKRAEAVLTLILQSLSAFALGPAPSVSGESGNVVAKLRRGARVLSRCEPQPQLTHLDSVARVMTDRPS